jgi:drug/metabolite transporter (DMT)-like permease
LSARTAGLTALAMNAFAANSLLCRAALERGDVDAFTFASVRLASGAVVLMILVAMRDERPRLAPAWPEALALFAYALLFSLAYTRIPAAVGALALFGAVQVTMIGRGLAAGERPAPREWLGLLLSLGGLAGLLLPGLASPDPLGLALMLLAGIAWGAYSLLGRGAVDPLAANAASFALAAPLSLVAQVVAVRVATPHATPAGLLLAIVSGALASGLGYAVWYAALRGLSATQAAVAQLSVPPLAALGAVMFLGESLNSRLLVSAAAILGGIALCLSPCGPNAESPSPHRGFVPRG